MTPEAIEALVRDGVQVFPTGADLYICPMYYAEDGFITPIAENTKFVLSIYEAPLPSATGFAACRSSFRRPDLDQAPTEAKASCVYPNVARAVQEPRDKGFDTAVVLDPAGHVAEFAYTNFFQRWRQGGHAGAQRHIFEPHHKATSDPAFAR